MNPPPTYPPGWCFHHEQAHGPMEWSDLCQSDDDDVFTACHARFQQAWQAVEESERELRFWRWRAGWLKRWTVCWWKHRTHKVTDGMYLSRSCWACADPT